MTEHEITKAGKCKIRKMTDHIARLESANPDYVGCDLVRYFQSPAFSMSCIFSHPQQPVWNQCAETSWGLQMVRLQDVLATKMSRLLYVGLKCPLVLKQWCNFTKV